MPKAKEPSWDFYSGFLLALYAILQVLRWRILPQSMDIYYHLLTAWGFIQAGGYSGWDFWQYAPFGRAHIYPPLFHLLLAPLIKSGIDKIILARVLETAMPVALLAVLWRFIRTNYNSCLAFFVLAACGSSFSFLLSLSNYLPATLAMTLGFLALEQLFRNRVTRALFLVALCFYTHIGVSWFFALGFVFWGLFDREYRKTALFVFASALILSFPVLFKQLVQLNSISLWGIKQKYFCEFKILDYILAFAGLAIALKRNKKYLLFPALFIASLVFVPYPYRFFSAQGFLPVILLSAVCLEALWEKWRGGVVYLRYLPLLLACLLLSFSPTILMAKREDKGNISYQAYFFDSAVINMAAPALHPRMISAGIWFPDAFLPVIDWIRRNSQEKDIIYSSLHNLGVCLASISGRATANGLLPETGFLRNLNPFAAARIIVFTKDDAPDGVMRAVNRYNLEKIGENRLFLVYKNPAANSSMKVRKAAIPFWLAGAMALIWAVLYWAIK